MASKPIPSIGLRAFNLLTDAYTEKKKALEAQYHADASVIGDEVLEVMGADPHDPALMVNFDEKVVTGFTDPVVQDILRQTMVKLEEQRQAEGTHVAHDAPDPQIAGGYVTVPPVAAATNGTHKPKKRGRKRVVV